MQKLIEKKKILWVDDDRYFIRPYLRALEDVGYEVFSAVSITEAKEALASSYIDLVITDIMMPVNTEEQEKDFGFLETKAGYETGIVLARWIRRNYPQTAIVGLTVRLDSKIREQFKKYGTDITTKYALSDVGAFTEYIMEILQQTPSRKKLKMFIVHGRDEGAKYDLKNYIQNTLKLGEPVILHERPSLGRTIIEKFEEEANDVDVVFVLLTPDDAAYDSSTPDRAKRRARQNVILELGYFLAKLERRRGRVLLLYKGQLELPSDISGLVYIDITNGVEHAGEIIRRELADLM